MKNLLMQDMKQTIRFFFMLMALMMGATSESWAQEPELTESDIVIDDGIEHGTVAFESVTNRTVTLTITPDAGYYIKASDIVVEKLVDPGKANAPKRRTPAIADVIPGTMYNSDMTKEISSVEAGSVAMYVFTVLADYDGVYVTATFTKLTEGETRITSSMTSVTYSPNGHYILVDDISATLLENFYSDNAFTGVFEGEAKADGTFPTISGLTHPLFNTVNGGVVKNVMLKNVHINQSGYVGAITGEAKGYTRIYNCGILPNDNTFSNRVRHSSVASTDDYCGGLVGLLKDDSRVINCFSFANVNGGTVVAGIVGYNDFASTAKVTGGKYTELKTAIVNCMFYGNITGGSTKYPVYGGNKILNNKTTGINNYDFYRAEANLGLADNSHYNCSWPAKEEYLTHYEYYRYLLNSNRELCGWWVGAPSAPSEMSTTDVQDVPKDASLMAKWVLDPSIAPYPILKTPGKYYSAINQDPDNRINPVSKTWESRPTSENTITTKAAPDTEGQKLGSITVNINKGGSLSGSASKSITITAMDIENNDFCYGKIQLPYYNSIFGDPSVEITGTTDAEKKSQWASRYGGNYGDQVVVGWEITSVTGGTEGTLVKHWQDGYNFADRDCTNKDKERIFAQGGYYYVPNGVTAITITAKWADAIYLDNSANNSYDRVYMSYNTDPNKNIGYHFAPAGHRPTTLGNGETVQTGTISSKLPTPTNNDVYNKAIVLVGNHQYRTGNANLGDAAKGCTILSADFDLDDEPDYSLIWQLGNQTSRYNICPIRFDFLPVIEMGMAMKEDGSTQYYSLGCYRPLGHFEVTETSLIHFGQFEFANQNRSLEAPLILNGGIYDQYTKGIGVGHAVNDDINYVIIGGNVYIPSFTPGAHVNDNANYSTRHCAVNIIGGRINNLYLTGNFNNKVTPNVDNPHCYIDGGNFKQVAAAGKEGINGDVYFKINHSVIEEFYGGSTMDQSTGNNFKTVKGNINVTVDNSKITKYCGGPKFGNMNLNDTDPTKNKTVTTNAIGTTFGVYYGGGNGGTSYVQYDKKDVTVNDATATYDWDTTGGLNGYTPNTYRSDGKNYIADYEMEIVNSSAGTDAKKGIFRTYLYAAQFSATNTGPITNNLTNCKVLTSFYGGGNLGGVIGDVESTLTDTEVMGSAFGAGYSASVPEVTIFNKDKTPPTINVYTGIITPTPDPDPKSTNETYTWCYKNKTTNVVIPAGVVIPDGVGTGNPTFEYDGKKYFYTEESLENLGTVTGNVTLNVDGTTTVGGSVYGGGEESNVSGNTQVNVCANYNSTTNKWESTTGTASISGNVFGGGKGEAEKTGDRAFYCEKAMVGINDEGACEDPSSDTNKIKGTSVHIGNGSVAGNVYGGGEVGRVEWNTAVTVGIEGDDNSTPEISGSVFGAGAGIETHGYSALVRGNSSVTVQGKAKVLQNVYGGGEKATVGRYWVKGIASTPCPGETQPTEPTDLPDGMPYHQRRGGICNVIIQGKAQVGPDGGGTETAGHVFGAGKGVTPLFVGSGEGKSQKMTQTGMADFAADATHETAEDAYLEFLQTLALVTNSNVTIDGSAIVKGSVYGGSESGYVQHDTKVTVSGGTIGTTDLGGAYFGNVYGGGKGDAEHMGTEKKYVAAGLVKGNTKVKIENGTILHNIYGGGAYGSVGEFTYDANGMPTGRKTYTVGETVESTTGGNTEVTITGGTIGSDGHENGMVFGSSRGDVATPEGEPAVDPNDRMAWVYSTHVKIGDTNVQSSPTIKGSIYGSGENGHTFQNTIVDVNKGIIGITDTSVNGGATYAYRGNVYGGGCGTDKYDSDNDGTKDKYNSLAGIVQGTTTVNITGGHVVHNVYGAGAMGSVGGGTTTDAGKTTINVTGGRIGYDGNENGHVFGAARGEFGVSDAASNLANVRETEVNINYATTPAADNEGKTEQLIAGSVFGGGEAGTVKGSVAVKMTGGLVLNDVYGGGALADTQTNNWDADANSKAGGWADAEKSALHTTTVRLTGGTILGEAYGGGLGETGKPAYVYGDVLLDLNGETKSGEEDMTIARDARGCAVDQVFGCNNADGTPMGDVLVHVHATQNKNKSQVANSAATVDTPAVTDAKQKGVYDVSAVYGGGNLAAYEPADPDNNKTEVVIDGCELTSIKQVYGGGNAACAPSTNVTVNGTFEVEELFGGGNGLDNIVINGVTKPNPGANVGYYNYSIYEKDGDTWKVKDDPNYDTKEKRLNSAIQYGTGKASVNIYGGTIHRVFGGSNTKGNVRQTALTLLDDNEGCTFCVDEAYGGGKSAEMDAEAKLLMACIPGLEAVYGGAEAADVRGNVTLNITNGTFDRVFGGNNLRGTISGSITVNVEEIGCKPVKIGELYGGGNQAGYSVYGYDSNGKPVESGTTPLYDDPQVNVMSFTSIGNVYGGGYGEGATMVGNPTVNINEAYGKYYNEDVSVVGENAKTPNNYPIPSHAKGKMGAISNVFGGGNAAKVIGNTTVNIGTLEEVYVVKEVTSGTALPAGCYTRNNDGTYSAATGTAEEGKTYYEMKTVQGVDIRGNVYGGGNNAEVTGNTNVNIGKKAE